MARRSRASVIVNFSGLGFGTRRHRAASMRRPVEVKPRQRLRTAVVFLISDSSSVVTRLPFALFMSSVVGSVHAEVRP